MITYTPEIDNILRTRVIYGPNIAYQGLPTLVGQLMENHLNDPSTGTYRERATILLSGAEAWPGQHGYDAHRNGRPIEIKPKTWNNGKRGNADGYGKINEHNLERHKKFLNEKMIMCQSQFFNGYCGWVIEFPYAWMKEHMETQIEKSKYRICGRFSYKNWIDCPDLEITWMNRELIEQHKNNIVGGCFKKPKLLYKWLLEH